MTTIATPTFTDEGNRRTWNKMAQRNFEEMIALMQGQELPEGNPEEEKMLEFYEKSVKKSAPKITKTKDGKLVVTDLPKALNAD